MKRYPVTVEWISNQPILLSTCQVFNSASTLSEFLTNLLFFSARERRRHRIAQLQNAVNVVNRL